MKTFVKSKEEYGEQFMRRRDERNRMEKEQRREEVKSTMSTTKVGIEELVSKYIEETTKRQAREEHPLTHNERIAKLEKIVGECTLAIKNGLKNSIVTEEIVNAINTGITRETTVEPKTFSEKVKSRIYKEKLLLDDLGTLPVNLPLIESIKDNSNKVQFVQDLINQKESLEEVESVKLNARCLAVLRNELPPKEKDPGSFTLPCLIGKLEISNALVDLGASISIMPYSMFLRLGVGSLKPIKMDIEMADKTMQSPKVCFFSRFVILEITEDDKIPIILGRPMLATAHAKVDVFARKMTIEVNGEVITFVANDIVTFPKKHNDISSGDDFDVFIDYEENTDALGVGLEDFQNEVDIVAFVDKQPKVPLDSGRPSFFGIGARIHHRNPYNLQLSCKIGYMDFHPFIDTSSVNIISKECYNQVMIKELEYNGNNFLGNATNIHVFIGIYTFLVDFVVLDEVSEFIEDGLTGVILGNPFKAISGLGEDAKEGIQLTRMRPLLELSDEDKANGYNYPYQKIKKLYNGCLMLGEEYKKNEGLIEWIQREGCHELEHGGPSRNLTRPLGTPSGLKGLLHMLNATMIPRKIYACGSVMISEKWSLLMKAS
ncbi:hypothetical protein CTI12_AA278390 [Artemisia annua]|uniref:Reverse transcriptase domain-containing protein n=1 Tax=Artemisia annua TaxID=35608 RepID=A0A2U1NDU1_ARTAN|nr:hypothetical protein CTI12_AA278390 [Artemisia annua]